MEPLTDILALFVPKVVFAILVIAGSLKLVALRSFRNTLFAIPVIPHRFKPFLAVAVPVFEILCGLFGLLVDPVVAAWLVLPLFGSFVVVAALAMHQSLRIECNCFGAGETTFGWSTIMTNVAMITGLAFLYIGNTQGFGWYGEIVATTMAGTAVLTLISLKRLRLNRDIYFRLFEG